jgi:hypothetical protein
MEVSVEYEATATVSHGRERRYPLNRRLSGTHSGLGNLEKRKISFLLPEIEIRTVQSVSLVTIQTTLSCLDF